MQNYGGYFQQYQQGQNPMYPTPGGQNNMNQTNTRNMFGGPQNYGMPQMPQAPQQQYGYQQQPQMPQQNFVFHFDYNNTPSNMNMNMGPYAPSNPPQYGAPPYGGPQIPQNNMQKKEDKNDQLFDAFDPFNPKPRAKPKPQPQQNTNPQPPAAPATPQIQMIEDIQPKKQDLNAFRTAFASLAGPAQQPQQPQQPQPQQQFGMQPGQMFGGNIQSPPPPQIEGFNFVSGTQNTQPVQMDNFNFGSQQQPQNNSFINQTPQQPVQPPSQSQPQSTNAQTSNKPQEDIFASFNPISSPQPTPSNQQQPANIPSANNQPPNQFGNSDTFSFNQPQTGSGSGFTFGQQQAGSNGGIQSFDQPQTGSGSGFTFGQQQTGSNGGIQSFDQPQTGSGSGFTFGQQQAGSNGGIQSFDQPQTGSGGGFTFGQQHQHRPQQAGSTGGILSFNVPQASTIDPIQSFNKPQAGSSDMSPSFNQPQAGSTGNLPISAIDDLFGSPSPSQNQQPPQNTPSTSDNPFLFNTTPSNSNPFVKSQNNDTNSSPLAPPQNINESNQQQEAQNNGMFNPFGSVQNQSNQSTTSTSFGDSFRQAIGESSPSSPPIQTQTDPQKSTENQSTDFRNIFSQGHNFFEQQEQQIKTTEPQQSNPVAPEGFTFGSQQPGDSDAPNFSNFTFNSTPQTEQGQNTQFNGQNTQSFGNFTISEKKTPPQVDQSQQFAPFGVTDIQPMQNSTFIISSSGDSVSSQPIAVSADPVDPDKIPYFAEQEKKAEFENRIKNDTMSVFDPFNPNPQPIQQEQQQQQQQVQNQQQNQQVKNEEPKLSASVNASVDTIRNMFGGPSDEPENNKEEDEKKPPQNDEQQIQVSPENNQLNDTNQPDFLGGFTSGFSTENNENKKPDIQLNVGMGDEENKDNNGVTFDNPFSVGGNSTFQENFGSSPEANSFGFGGFGFNNSFGKGNVFQHMFEQGNNEKPATFNDFFPHHNSEPITAPIQVNEKNDENKEKPPPKSETPFATGFDLMGFEPPKQNENKEEEKKNEQNPFIFGDQQKIDFNNPFGSPENEQQNQNQNKQKEEEQKEISQNQKDIDFDNPFTNQSNLSLFGQAPDSNNNKQTNQKNEPFNPFGNQNMETASQTSSSLSFSSTEVINSQPEIQNKKEEPETIKKTETKQSKNNKGGDIFDEIPNDISEIDKSLPEKPPPFVMPTIGDNSSNPFTSVLSSSSSPSSNPFTSNNNNNKENPFVTKEETKQEDSSKQQEKEKEEPKNNNNGLDDLIGFDFGFSSSKTENNNNKDNDNPFLSNLTNNENDEKKIDEKINDNKETTKEEKTEEKQQDTSGFTFSSATPTNNTNDSNSFSKGFNPFGGDFANPFTTPSTTTTPENNNNEGGFTFTPSFNEDEKKQQQQKENEEENINDKQQDEQKIEEPAKNEETTDKNDDQNMNITDTLDDDLFDMNSIEDFKPVQHKGKNSDLFGEIHTFPVSNSTSDFLELKQKKENKNNVGQSFLMMSDGGPGQNKPSISPLTEKSHQNNQGFISILTPYGNATDEVQFSQSSDGEDPEVLKIMGDDNQMSKILKKYIKQPENDFYGSFEKDPHPIRIFPKFEDTKAAKVLADFVSNQFGITASFASTSRKQKEEIDVNSIFNVPAASEPNDDDDFLLII